MKNRILPQSILLLYFCIFLSVSASAQNVRVTLKMENQMMETVMDAIEQQTRYLFTVDDGVDLNRRISINVQDAPLNSALDQIVAGAGVTWAISETNIIISPKAAPESRKVTGKVTDPSGLPVPGVSVLIRNTDVGTVTDLDGVFSLEIPGENLDDRLEFNSLGYEIEYLPIGQRSVFNVTLTESSLELEGTVVTALGIRRDQKALSYNVQEVSSDLVTGVKDANFINSLSGKVAGVTINASSSGVGGASKVVLRGNKSISQSSNALYVIDGVPMYNFGGGGGTEFDSQGATESIADINPEDIQSISVLTGAAAAALYGSQAANGAVMITTKKGEAGRLKVTFSSNTEFLDPFRLPEFQNRYGTGLNGKNSGSGIYSWGPKMAQEIGYTPQDYFETGHTYTNAFTVSGGTDKNQTYFSAAAVNSDGIIPNNLYDRYNFTFRNTTYFLNDKLRLDASAS
ncbi:MAG: TonB-dependent receptor plug domain-containing protein, partial [Bacteroidales bacterium]|nr:TonB-dependent receptor plug domain-containing protein [Bacteroidales bacterium]